MSYQWSKADQQVGEGFLRIAREQIGKAADWAGKADEPAAKRIHEARRRSKKLRALFRLVRPGFAEFSEANAFVRDAARELAPFRDGSVLRDTLDDLLARAGQPPIARNEPPHEETEAERVALVRFVELMLDLEQRTTDWRLDRISLSTLSKGLRHTYRRGRQTRRTALRHQTDEAFHDWRKFAKYHWNQLGLLEDCAPDVLPAAHRIAGELADLLGLHHDLAILAKVLADDPGSLGVDTERDLVTSLLEARQAELEAQIEQLGRQVFAEKPRALEARFAAYFSGWPVLEAAGLMAIEIERKFLVVSDAWRAQVRESQTLRQGYLSSGGAGVTVRIRSIDDRQGFITIKSGGSALARTEFEYEIPIADARQMLGLSRGGRIEKTRHLLDLPGGEWVVDEFLGRHSGLIMAEVELDTPTAVLDLPPWLGEEVTGNPHYYNSSLAMLVGGEI